MGAPPLALLNSTNGGADIANIFEGSLSKWDPSTEVPSKSCIDQLYEKGQGAFVAGPWCQYVPNWGGVEPIRMLMGSNAMHTQFAVMLHDTPALGSVLHQAKAAGIKYVYASALPFFPNPWAAVPVYWCEVIGAPEGTSCSRSPSIT